MSEKIEETVEEVKTEIEQKKSFKEKMKDPKYNKWKIAIVCFLVCCIAGAGYYIYSSLNWTADKIVRELVLDKSNLEMVTFEDNTNNIAYFKDSLIKVEGVEYTGMIEVFKNKTEALLKKDYYVLYDTEMMKAFNETTLGADLAKIYGTGNHTVYVNGNTLIRLSYHYSEYQANQLIKQFDAVMEKTYQSEKNVPTSEQQETIKKNYQKQVQEEIKTKKDNLIAALQEDLNALKKEVEQADIDRLLEIKEEAEAFKTFVDLAKLAVEVQDAVDAKLQSQVDTIDEMLDEAENEYSRDKVQAAKDAIQLLTHTFFEEYKVQWNDRIDQILHQIKEKEIQDYKDKCVDYADEYDDIDESYKGKYAYFKGKIEEISTNSSGRISLHVKVNPVYGLFAQNTITGWKDSVIVDVDDGVSAFYDQGDIIEMWGTLEGMTSRDTWISSNAIPEFYCKYADGE